jgi:hypothetical protein
MEKIFNKKSFNYFVWPLLSPVSTTPVVDTGGKSLIPVVHHDLHTSPRIFAKKLKFPQSYFQGLGERDDS